MRCSVRWRGALVLLLAVSYEVPVAASGFDSGKLAFSVTAKDLEFRYRVFALFVLPGEHLELRSATRLELESEAGSRKAVGPGWVWTAPTEVGWYPLRLRSTTETMTINIFVIRPATQVKDGKLGSYEIGTYSRNPFRGLLAYRAPDGFVEVTPEVRDVQVSPHFTLGQFLCKQESGWPKYLVLRPELLIKLERILEQVRQAGIRTDSFEIMSGYRTPWYNRLIGNRTDSSRHLYGGAADIFVDVAPRDGVMDDLNGDGEISKADADYLYNQFERWSTTTWWQQSSGGLAAYGPTKAHGPFVHVDARGYRARWRPRRRNHSPQRRAGSGGQADALTGGFAGSCVRRQRPSRSSRLNVRSSSTKRGER